MSARLADCASLFQLAFGLNIVPAAFASFNNFQTNLRTTLEGTVTSEKSYEPNIKYRNDAIKTVQARMTRRYYKIFNFIRTLVGCSLILSTIGLLGAAEHPDSRIANFCIDLFTVVCIILSPLACSIWARICISAIASVPQLLEKHASICDISLTIRAQESIHALEDAARSLNRKDRWAFFLLRRRSSGIFVAIKSVLGKPRHCLEGAEKGIKNIHIS